MLNATTERVRLNTEDAVNARIHSMTKRRIAFYVEHPELIEQRLAELDEEWDIERLIETEAPTMTTMGMVLGALFGRKWLVLPLFAQSMVFLHAVQGWYPLLPLFRRMGFRTPKEIAIERYALKALRGDFGKVSRQNGQHRRGDKAFKAAAPART